MPGPVGTCPEISSGTIRFAACMAIFYPQKTKTPDFPARASGASALFGDETTLIRVYRVSGT